MFGGAPASPREDREAAWCELAPALAGTETDLVAEDAKSFAEECRSALVLARKGSPTFLPFRDSNGLRLDRRVEGTAAGATGEGHRRFRSA